MKRPRYFVHRISERGEEWRYALGNLWGGYPSGPESRGARTVALALLASLLFWRNL